MNHAAFEYAYVYIPYVAKYTHLLRSYVNVTKWAVDTFLGKQAKRDNAVF